MKQQDTEARLAAAKKENERLRNEIHNLKRKVKRMESHESALKANTDAVASNQKCRTELVSEEAIADIKKKLKADGMTERGTEVMDWFLSQVTGSQ